MATRTPHALGTRAAALAEPELPRALQRGVAPILVFISSGAVLVLEILAVRLLAPYVGLTLEATTSIIGAALAGIAVGAAVGGRLADRTDARRLVIGLLVGGGLLALLTVPLVRWLGPSARGHGELTALGITVVALVPAAAALSAVSPAVAHLQLHDLRHSGTVVGRLSAWATAGALVGTFGTGFVLVPLMSVSAAVLLTSGVLIATGIGLGAMSGRFVPAAAGMSVIAALALGVLSTAPASPCDAETTYHCASINVDPQRVGGRELRLDDLQHSYIDLHEPQHLEYPYTRWIADGIDATNPARSPLEVVFVGGGGFTLPRWVLSTRPGSKTHVLEVDGELVDLDRERLGLRTSAALRVTVGDARISIRDERDDSADVVVGDAFGSLAVPWHLATAEWTDDVRRILRPAGLYALNVVDLGPLDLLRAETATLLDAFVDLALVTYPSLNGDPRGGNAVLLASDRPLPTGTGSNADGAVTYDRDSLERFAAAAEVLRDDHAPVDQLLTTSGR